MRMNRLAKSIILGMVLSTALAGCGRKSALDTPYQAQLDAREEARDNDEPLPPAPEKPVEDRPFILDGLID
ncbi:MAG: lipoprotein [Rhizobiaceae bacterium]|nr:lipoprotein [Rhizobiaceae bacterium]MCV0407697.1 lipoprotein [Rhizobiaceae bacterium]